MISLGFMKPAHQLISPVHLLTQLMESNPSPSVILLISTKVGLRSLRSYYVSYQYLNLKINGSSLKKNLRMQNYPLLMRMETISLKVTALRILVSLNFINHITKLIPLLRQNSSLRLQRQLVHLRCLILVEKNVSSLIPHLMRQAVGHF